jgi:flavin-dependent dehydrogenase
LSGRHDPLPVRHASALIVGGGPAGAAAAITLGRAGAMPMLIERASAPRDIVCGGFLGWDALAALQRLGLDAAALGARPIRRLRLVSGGRAVEAALPKAAAGLSRRCLDEALLVVAEQAGASVLRGRAARAINGRIVRLDGGEEIEADAVFLATGKHELRGAGREIGGRPVSVGLRAAFAPSGETQAALAGTIELHLYDGGYAGLLLQEDGAVNLCLTVARERMRGKTEALIAALVEEAPLLGERIGGAMPAHWDAVARVPYGWQAGGTAPGCYRLGDQAAVIASLAGDGIAIALASGVAAAHACLKGTRSETWQRDFAARAARPVGVAEALRLMAARRPGRAAMMGLAGVPGLARAAARLTRIGS